MPAGRIYCETEIGVGQTVLLSDAASHYVSRVLRLREGDSVVIFNGHGGEYSATVVAVLKKNVELSVSQFVDVDNESRLNIELGLGIVRGERMDFAIQKAVELGVTTLTPLFTNRSNIKLDSTRAAKRLAHWQAIAISASEQSGRCFVPKIQTPLSLTAWLEKQPSPGFIADPASQEKLPASHVNDQVNVLVGPEGGFTDEEITQCVSEQWQPFSMGPRVLRTETAAVVAVAMLQMQWGDIR